MHVSSVVVLGLQFDSFPLVWYKIFMSQTHLHGTIFFQKLLWVWIFIVVQAVSYIFISNTYLIILEVVILFLGCTWRHHFLKSKSNEAPKLLSASGIRGGKFISVNNFSVQLLLSSSKNRHILNFRVMAVRDIKLWKCTLKNIFSFRDF